MKNEVLRNIKKAAKEQVKMRENRGYYCEKYGDMSLAGLLLTLENENFHSEEVLLECIAHMDYCAIVDMCKVIVEQDKAGYLTPELGARRDAIIKTLRKYDK